MIANGTSISNASLSSVLLSLLHMSLVSAVTILYTYCQAKAGHKKLSLILIQINDY